MTIKDTVIHNAFKVLNGQKSVAVFDDSRRRLIEGKKRSFPRIKREKYV